MKPDSVREVMGIIGSIMDTKYPIREHVCECGERFLFWATFCDHLAVSPRCSLPRPLR